MADMPVEIAPPPQVAEPRGEGMKDELLRLRGKLERVRGRLREAVKDIELLKGYRGVATQLCALCEKEAEKAARESQKAAELEEKLKERCTCGLGNAIYVRERQ
jgi:hypothetical protein